MFLVPDGERKKFDSTIKLTMEDCALIMDNCFSNLFVTDSAGKIIFANRFSEKVLGCPAEALIQMDIYQLLAKGYVSHSFTDDAIRTKKQVTGSYFTKEGKEIATVCTPVLNYDGSLRMVVTYSREMGDLGAFMEEITRQQRQINEYKGAINYLHSANERSEEVIARDPQMQYITDLLRKLSKTDSAIMLYGESGVGKEVAANFIRQNSLRKKELFFPINCAAMPADLVESELFGYERGAFTGANREGKRGLFDLANGGTVFLDEVGELSLSAQSKLLRVLENGEYRRVGGDKICTTDVRIIGATNRNLKQMVAEKTFRGDLYYRLNVFPITIPPLRQRPQDMEALAEQFLAKYNRKHGQTRVISESLLAAMHQYAWPGNIRELRNVVERYVITGENTFLPVGLHDVPLPGPAELPSGTFQHDKSLREFLAEAELDYIRAVLDDYGGVVAKAAKKLGIHRSVLYKKIKQG